MDDFKPSCDFVSRTMDDVRQYEMAINKPRERMNAFLLWKPAFLLLAAGGILLGAAHLIEMAWLLISPASCL